MRQDSQSKPGLPGILLPWKLGIAIRLFSLIPLLLSATIEAPASEPTALEILATHCNRCHGDGKTKQHLNLTSSTLALKGSENGPVIIPGQPEDSLIVQLLDPESDPHMPPEGQLTPQEIEQIKDWIRSMDKTERSPRLETSPSPLWSFQPLTNPPPPRINTRWVRTPIDAFISAQHRNQGLSHSPAATSETLLRRVSFDLVGLPPTPEERNTFLNDSRVDAYERLVDRLLASPQYGERWGRHWLDLARYADSSGFHDDLHRPHAWRYRDYVISSFNEDKPYHQFLTEQLAGDLLPSASASTWVATGFARNGPSNENNMGAGEFKERYRYDQLDDALSTTASVFLGITLGCARCHDHKYDPITQRDYYRFLAYFHDATKKTLNLDSLAGPSPQFLPSSSKQKPHDDHSPLAAVFTDHDNPSEPTRILWRGSVRNKGPIVSAGVPTPLSTSDREIQDRLDLARWMTDATHPLTWRVIANRVWAFHFGEGLVQTPSNFGTRAQPPTHPDLLDYLASKLVSRQGSLKQLHREIVTSSTYRQTSEKPARDLDKDPSNLWWTRMNKRHLESEILRDAILATGGNLNLEAGGPGIKPRIRPDLLSASQRNKWPDLQEEGPQQWRRSVYIYVKRQLPFPMLELFGSPGTSHSCAKRAVSQVPTQALVLLNDQFMIQQATAFAQRVRAEGGSDLESQLRYAHTLALGKGLSHSHEREALDFVHRQKDLLLKKGLNDSPAQAEALALYCQVLFNLSEFVYIE